MADENDIVGKSLDESQAKGTRIVSIYMGDGRVEVFVHRSFAAKCDIFLLTSLQEHLENAVKRAAAQEGNKI